MDKQVLNVTDDVKWIGVLDPDLRVFDIIMETKYGTTYNSYFINAEKKAIIESTKEKFWETYLAKINQVCNPEEVEYIILNHTEPDHSSNLKNMLAIMPNATVVGSGNAIRYVTDQMGITFKSIAVKEGDTLSLGNKTLQFISAPNLHWPDSIYTYLPEDRLLFTCDSFGAHYCREDMADDFTPEYSEAFKYYFDVILKPYSKFMLKAIEKIRPLEIDALCTGHGPIVRQNVQRFIDLSEQYAREATELCQKNRVFVPYVSAYGNTKQIALAIEEGLKEVEGLHVECHDIETMPPAEVDDQITRASGIIVGTPVINQNVLPQIYQLFATINPIRDRSKYFGAFGSYGWSGEGEKIIEAALTNLKLKYIGEGQFYKFSLHAENVEKAREYGRNFGAKVMNDSCQS